MVRTKKRARTKEETYPSGPPNIKLPAKTSIASNNLVFKDHTGRPALMSWESRGVKRPLPPLASWVFYMVHPDVATDFDGCAFQTGLEDCSGLCRGGTFRYEFFFLPGATAEECHTHYRGEMEARGTIWRQIRKVKRAVKRKKRENGEEVEDDSGQESSSNHDVAPSANQLPGLVWPKRDRDCEFVNYRGWFFMYPDADIKCGGAAGHARDVYLVRFDPIPQEWAEDEVPKFDPMEHPVHSKRMKARDPEYFECGLFGWMEMRKNSVWEEMADDATRKALELGWESW
ncbi:hypothetical protein B0T10DRAFT_481120 [Thelonectria olida]|uniref:Uncharacterized protein n=1 Tax=Thelonectria olida TaxID=1576542 RepID=A0A9P8W844_9HYPO|nr:hypothetical protein B0T10DRAFT_481120 [Thelonectria olida]